MKILTFGFLSLIAAIVLSLFLYFYARRRIRKEANNRIQVLVVSALSPFLALLWLVASLLIHVVISNLFAHQDSGLSPDPYVTLPNGYVLGSHNTYDGYIAAPGFKTDVPIAGPGYVRSIIDLQFSDGYFIGTQFDLKTSRMRNFVFDTRTQVFDASDINDSSNLASQGSEAGARCANSPVMDAWAAAETRAHNDANSYWKLYAQYRHHWPDYVLIVLITVGVVSIMLWVTKIWDTGLTTYVERK